jgi:hypothetical protein
MKFGTAKFECNLGAKVTVTEDQEMFVDDELVDKATGFFSNFGIPFLSTTTLRYRYYDDQKNLNELKAVMYYMASHQKVTIYINEQEVASGFVSAG